MANELKITKTINYESGTLKYMYSPGTIQLPQATRGYVDQTVSVTSVEANVAMTAAVSGMCFLRSLEATTTGNAVVWGSTAGLSFALLPKRTAEFTFASSATVLAMQTQGAIAATVRVQVLMFEA